MRMTQTCQNMGLVKEYRDGFVTFVSVWFNNCITYTEVDKAADCASLHCSRADTSCYKVFDRSLLSVKPFGTSPTLHQTTYKQGVDTKTDDSQNTTTKNSNICRNMLQFVIQLLTR